MDVKPQLKKKMSTVDKIDTLSQRYKTILISSIQNLPSAPFEKLRKKLRGKAEMIVAKNVLVRRALEKTSAKDFLSVMEGPSVIIFTDLSPLQIHGLIEEGKSKAYAKPGQVAPHDIVVPAGETTLPPGPVLSELKMVGIDARLDKGKIVIAKDCTVAKKGDKIKKEVANTLIKLNIMPMEIKMLVVGAFEKDSGLVYKSDVLSITPERLTDEIKAIARNSINLALKTDYPTKETMAIIIPTAVLQAKNLAITADIISFDSLPSIIRKAYAHANVLNSRIPQQTPQPSEEPVAGESEKEDKKEV